MFVEFLVGFCRLDSRSPSGLPVVGDVEDMLHKHLEVDEDSAAEIFANVIFVILASVFIDPIRLGTPDARERPREPRVGLR